MCVICPLLSILNKVVQVPAVRVPSRLEFATCRFQEPRPIICDCASLKARKLTGMDNRLDVFQPLALQYIADDIINNFKAGKIGGVVLSSGAGNPNILTDEIAEIKRLIDATAYRDWETDRKSTRLNSSHRSLSRMPSSA